MKSTHIATLLLATIIVVSSSGGMAAKILGQCSVNFANTGLMCVQKDCSVVCAEKFDGGIGICNGPFGCTCTYLCGDGGHK
ncbi:hypothetical protein ACP70R_026109 [Stipagrostis hirtigluma subsp. patula]